LEEAHGINFEWTSSYQKIHKYVKSYHLSNLWASEDRTKILLTLVLSDVSSTGHFNARIGRADSGGRDLDLGQLRAQVLKLSVGLLEVIVSLELEHVAPLVLRVVALLLLLLLGVAALLLLRVAALLRVTATHVVVLAAATSPLAASAASHAAPLASVVLLAPASSAITLASV
jgi:hypothetical protein